MLVTRITCIRTIMMLLHFADVFGPPDLFVTFTCNPQWAEIGRLLMDIQRANDQPDIISRVFKMKYDELLANIRQRHYLGKTVAGNFFMPSFLISCYSLTYIPLYFQEIFFLITCFVPFLPLHSIHSLVVVAQIEFQKRGLLHVHIVV